MTGGPFCRHHACVCTLAEELAAEGLTVEAVELHKDPGALVPCRQAAAAVWSGYPSDWPPCPGCGLPALDGHITCGDAGCGEAGHRARAALRKRRAS